MVPSNGPPCGGSSASRSLGKSTELSGITTLEAREREREDLGGGSGGDLSGATLWVREQIQLGWVPTGLGGMMGCSSSITVDGAVGLE